MESEETSRRDIVPTWMRTVCSGVLGEFVPQPRNRRSSQGGAIRMSSNITHITDALEVSQTAPLGEQSPPVAQTVVPLFPTPTFGPIPVSMCMPASHKGEQLLDNRFDHGRAVTLGLRVYGRIEAPPRMRSYRIRATRDTTDSVCYGDHLQT